MKIRKNEFHNRNRHPQISLGVNFTILAQIDKQNTSKIHLKTCEGQTEKVTYRGGWTVPGYSTSYHVHF